MLDTGLRFGVVPDMRCGGRGFVTSRGRVRARPEIWRCVSTSPQINALPYRYCFVRVPTHQHCPPLQHPMTLESTNKRRRIGGDANDNQILHTSPENQRSNEGYGFDTGDPFLSPATFSSWPFDEFTHDPDYLASQDTLRSLLFTTARSNAPTRAGTPEDGDVLIGQVNIKHVLSRGGNVHYFKNYMSSVAPWVGTWTLHASDVDKRQLDMFDCTKVFGIRLPALAKESPPLLFAILAIGARQLERKEQTASSFDSLELYQEAIRLLTPLLSARDPHVIAACVVLCCLEMLSASARDWRRHLEGCAAIFGAFGVNGFSGDVLQAVFWCYARMGKCERLEILDLC